MLTEQLDDRMTRRRQIREQAAKAELELAPIGLWQADIAASQQRADEAADWHAAACEPWQTELQALEQKAVQRISLRQSANDAEDARRMELTSLINEANSELETTIEKENETQAELRTKIRRLQTGRVQPYITLNRLARADNANPELLAQQHCNRQRIRFASARVAAAKASLRIADYNRTGVRAKKFSGDLVVSERKLEHALAEVAAAQKEEAEAIEESNQIHSEILSE